MVTCTDASTMRLDQFILSNGNKEPRSKSLSLSVEQAAESQKEIKVSQSRSNLLPWRAKLWSGIIPRHIISENRVRKSVKMN